MGKYQQECDYQLIIYTQVKDIELLKEQVRILREVLQQEYGIDINTILADAAQKEINKS